MMRYLALEEVVELQRQVIEQSGGSHGIRDQNLLDSAIAQPRMAFGGQELYPTIIDKAAALAFSLVMNHPFVDGNKRIGHAAMETFLMLNGYEINAGVDEQEQVFLSLATGTLARAVCGMGTDSHGRTTARHLRLARTTTFHHGTSI